MNCRFGIGLLALGLAACGSNDSEGVSETPTWFVDVKPIIAANCASCHGAIPFAPTVEDFRLDRYVKNDPNTFDAYDYRDLIVTHAVDREAPAMPVSGELSETDKETLRRWVEQGAAKGTRANVARDVERIAPTMNSVTADQELALRFRSFDDDDDGLIVEVGYRNLDASNEVIVFSSLASGETDVSVDTGQLLSLGHFEIFVRLDDGYSDEPSENRYDVVLIEDLLVDHGQRGTAPTVTVLTPNGGDTLLGPTSITWEAIDPDEGDTLSIDIELLKLDGGGRVEETSLLASGLANAPASFAWDPSEVPTEENGTSIPYRIRVTATDAGAQNSRDDVSDSAFTVATAGGNTDLTWDDVKPLFLMYCGECHTQPAKTMALEYFRLDKYDAADSQAPTNTDIGVYEQRSLVYQRLVVAGTMPPNASPQMSSSQMAQIDEWILAGAPLGGSGDAPPQFGWTTPNDTATTQVGNASLTLEWSASDPEGLPLSGNISMAELPNGTPPLNPATATCDGSELGYAEVVGDGNIEDGTFTVTLPNPGFFCFKGIVIDEFGQTVSVTAGRPVRF